MLYLVNVINIIGAISLLLYRVSLISNLNLYFCSNINQCCNLGTDWSFLGYYNNDLITTLTVGPLSLIAILMYQRFGVCDISPIQSLDLHSHFDLKLRLVVHLLLIQTLRKLLLGLTIFVMVSVQRPTVFKSRYKKE